MNVQARDRQFLSLTERLQAARAPKVVTFDSPADFLAFTFGPPQHDQHVTARRRHRFLESRKAWKITPEQNAEVSAWVKNGMRP